MFGLSLKRKMSDLPATTKLFEEFKVAGMCTTSRECIRIRRGLSSLKQANLLSLQALLNKGDFKAAKQKLSNLKVIDTYAFSSVCLMHTYKIVSASPALVQIQLTKLPALPPTFQQTKSAQKELILASKYFE